MLNNKSGQSIAPVTPPIKAEIIFTLNSLATEIEIIGPKPKVEM